MIATIRSEWIKSRFRPVFLISAGLLTALVALVYGANWYQALHPGGPRQALPIATLYPDQFVNAVINAGFPLGAAIAIVVGAIFAGSEYGWATLKTLFTQGPGRLTVWGGRVVVFVAWMGVLTAVLFVTGAISSVVVASFQGAAIAWPQATDILKGLGAIWLILSVNGAIGMALGILVRQPGAALGIGLIYVLAVEIIAVRFIDSLNSGAYKWIGNLFVNQNATALIQSFNSVLKPAVSSSHAVLVLAVYGIALLAIGGGLIRARDVA